MWFVLRCAAKILRPFSGSSLRREESGGSQSAHTSSLTWAGCTLVGHATQRRLTPRLALLLPIPQLHCFCSCFPLCKLWDCLSSSAPGPPRCCRGDCRENGVSGCALAGSENFWNNEKRGEMGGQKDMWDAKEMSLCHTACSALVHVFSTFWSEECLGLSLAFVMHCYRYALTLWTSPENNTGARNYKSLQLNTCTGSLSKIFLSYTQNNSW